MTDILTQTREGGLLTLSMNRPERRNALNAELCDALVAALRAAAADASVHVVLLRGEGGTFCVGGDVAAFAQGGASRTFEEKAIGLRGRMEASRLLHEMRKPTIAAIHGSAAGAGLSMALACDFRVVSATAKLTTAFAKVGLSGDYGGTYFLTKLLGAARARELYLLSPVLSGAEAHAIGLATRVADDPAVDATAVALAHSLLALPPITLGYIKQNLNVAEQGSLADCLDGEAMRHTRCSETEDHLEAARAFVGKRPPVFIGR